MSDDKQINNINEQINSIFLELGFVEVFINGQLNYRLNNLHCKVSFVKSLGFIIEYADSHDEAAKNLYEDGDAFPLSVGASKILEDVKSEIVQCMPHGEHFQQET